ncbi:MAG TPA: hypothetical protein VF081_14360 [Solirubrobacterales bacterium]
MSAKRKVKSTGRSSARNELLSEDHSEIKLVPAKDRAWWGKLSAGAKARFAARHRKKWTDDETQQLILADPDSDDYYELGARMGRGPGALRARRSQMIHLLREEYNYVEKAGAYFADPKSNHKFADIAQVYRLLGELKILELPVNEQFNMARHLKQPSKSWRGDNSSAVEREEKARARALRQSLEEVRRSSASPSDQ